ncbi:MAG: Holliday junction resolvase RuvX [Peptoniphilaceae bacterium]|nr:Holliday junction resolvase RuvX [Peptoniphilaceae bacterium]MDD7433614.1 Holliday junction resolvase RuvX [Peptoniphilaceae bacterium]MDY3076079.1 Holliday junction resolvase RuvX [Peptoniphilaceae bacterium]MDY4196901.1 Holliday junction resolvase RuvX [Peptoniphilaceae bacterium]MDY5841695.1 Holliday junction resolvase RuvX [Peptoniphilaceae bacterium]
MARTMGLDLGTRTIGVAVSDPTQQIAQAVTTIRRSSFRDDLAKLRAIIEEYDVNIVVIGLPKHMNNDEGASAQRARSFGVELRKATGLEIDYQDERLSTVTAEQVLQQSGVRRENRKKYIDRIAATVILQAWLDRRIL